MITVAIKGGNLNGLMPMVNEIVEKFKEGHKFTDEENLILNTYIQVGAYMSQHEKGEDMMEWYFK